MRFLLDTNILIPLEDSQLILEPSLTNFIRLANQHGHALLYHPASEADISRDANVDRKRQTLARIARYQRLDNPPSCPWNTPTTSENDAADNEILYAVKINAVRALITEDRGLHVKARQHGLQDRVYYIQTAEDWLKRLHRIAPVSLPNITEVDLFQLDVNHSFFDSLRAGYGGQAFNEWFARAQQAGRKTWMYGNDYTNPQAVCIYDVQTNERITDDGQTLSGRALKLCTFKVGEAVRGMKIGELFLKGAFRYATDNGIENIFITTMPDEVALVDLLSDFGFSEVGSHGADRVFLKPHPVTAPIDASLTALEYNRRYFPHYRDNTLVQKFIVPIIPEYHNLLFPDWTGGRQIPLPLYTSQVGNAIKLAYLCHAQMSQFCEGDIIMFYRSHDSKALTSVGVIDKFLTSSNAEDIAGAVSRRTVYTLDELRTMANRPTKVILFRLVKHFANPVPSTWLAEERIVNGNIQTIRKINEQGYRKISAIAR